MVTHRHHALWLLTGLGVLAGVASLTSVVTGATGNEDPGPTVPDLAMPSPREAIQVLPEKPIVEHGFRMESAAELELVVGDSKELEQRIDRFYATVAAMDQTRHSYFRDVRQALDIMGYTGVGEPVIRRGVCPEGLAAPYRAAYQAGDRFRKLGAFIENEQAIIRELHRLGESAGLTPNYRFQANRVRNIYRESVIDYREMRATMLRQIMPEVHVRRCVHEKLMRETPEAVATTEPTPSASQESATAGRPAPATDKAGETAESLAHVEAQPVTFFVDNRDCARAFQLVLTGVLAGRVPAGARVAFQAPIGRHAMCLLPATSEAPDGHANADAGVARHAGASADSAAQEPSATSCGEKGTVRTGYIHDGWALVTHCW